MLSPEREFAALLAMGKHLLASGFLPEAVKTPAQVAVLVLTGRELGIPPMHALRSIQVIKGKPTLSADLQLALFHRAGGRSQVLASDTTRCEMAFVRPDGGRHLELFTVEDAKRAGLAGKDMWRTYPKAMLRARCISSGLRVCAPDIMAGLYDPDELDGAPGDTGLPDAAGPAPWHDRSEPEPAEDVLTRDTPLGFGRHPSLTVADLSPGQLAATLAWSRLPAAWRPVVEAEIERANGRAVDQDEDEDEDDYENEAADHDG